MVWGCNICLPTVCLSGQPLDIVFCHAARADPSQNPSSLHMHSLLIALAPSCAQNPYEFIGCGDGDAQNTYEFIGFGVNATAPIQGL